MSINLSSCCCMLGGTWRVSSSSGGAGDLKSADIWSSVAPLLCGGDAFASATLEMLD